MKKVSVQFNLTISDEVGHSDIARTVKDKLTEAFNDLPDTNVGVKITSVQVNDVKSPKKGK